MTNCNIPVDCLHLELQPQFDTTLCNSFGDIIHSCVIYAEPLSIKIFGKVGQVSYAKTFGLGDYAEYDTDTFIHYGTISNITKRYIAIKDNAGRRYELDLFDFAHKNWNFVLSEAENHNFTATNI